MAITMKKCRTCGKMYKPCTTVGTPGIFRWQEVACSPECGAEYLRLIEESRGIAKPSVAEPRKEKHSKKQAKASVFENISEPIEGHSEDNKEAESLWVKPVDFE